MAKRRFNFVNGNLDLALGLGDTSMLSEGLKYLPEIKWPDYLIISFDPERQFGAPEICLLVDHNDSAITATIRRAEFGTLARSHPIDTPWVHSALAEDFADVGDGLQDVYIQDTLPLFDRETGIWIQTGLGESGNDFTFWFQDGQ